MYIYMYIYIYIYMYIYIYGSIGTASSRNAPTKRLFFFMHPRPPGRHIARDRRLTTILSFELKFFVCRHVSM